jgi:hypothetical protein
VGVDAIAIRDHFGVVVGVSFGGGTGGGVWLLVSTASAALYVHYSVYVLEPPLACALSQHTPLGGLPIHPHYGVGKEFRETLT